MKKKKIYIGLIITVILSIFSIFILSYFFNDVKDECDYQNFNNKVFSNPLINSVPGVINNDVANTQEQNTVSKANFFNTNVNNVKSTSSQDTKNDKQESGKQGESKKEESNEQYVFYGDLNSDKSSSVLSFSDTNSQNDDATTIYYKWDDSKKTIFLNSICKEEGYNPFETKGGLPPWHEYNKEATTVVIESDICPSNTSYFFSAAKGTGYGPCSSIVNFKNLGYLHLDIAKNVDFTFAGLTKEVNLEGEGGLNLRIEKANSAVCMFQHSNFVGESGKTLVNSVMSSINSGVEKTLEEASYMFANCASLDWEIFCPNLTSEINASGMFANNCITKFYFPEGIKCGNNADCTNFLYGCCNLEYVDVRDWEPYDDVNFKVDYLFCHCGELKTIQHNESWFDKKNIKGKSMYYGCSALPNFNEFDIGFDASEKYYTPSKSSLATYLLQVEDSEEHELGIGGHWVDEEDKSVTEIEADSRLMRQGHIKDGVVNYKDKNGEYRYVRAEPYNGYTLDISFIQKDWCYCRAVFKKIQQHEVSVAIDENPH